MTLEIVQTSPMGGKPIILFPQKYFTAYAIGIGPFAGQRLWLWLRTLFQSCTVSLLYFTSTKCIQSFRVDQSCVKCLRKCECNAKFLVFSLFGLKLDAIFLWSTWLSNEAKSLIQTETSPCTSERWPNTSRNKRNTNFNFSYARQVHKEMGTWSVPGMTSLCTLRKIPQIR